MRRTDMNGTEVGMSHKRRSHSVCHVDKRSLQIIFPSSVSLRESTRREEGGRELLLVDGREARRLMGASSAARVLVHRPHGHPSPQVLPAFVLPP